MIVISYIVFALLFLLELAGLAAFAYWGFHIGKSFLTKVVFGIGTPLLIAIIWGTFVAPKATYQVGIPIEIFLKMIIFGLATAALFFSNQVKLAAIFGAIVCIILFLSYFLEI
jgi:hypothetical protein